MNTFLAGMVALSLACGQVSEGGFDAEAVGEIWEIQDSAEAGGFELESAQGLQAAPPLAVATASNEFGFELYQQLRESSDGNLLLSPTSISLALAMVHAGAKGQTQQEIANVLHFDTELPEEKRHAEQALLLAALQYGSDPTEGGLLAVANRIWVQEDYGILPEFATLTEQQYQAKLAEADFNSDADAVRREINAWVEEQTYDKIQNLFPAGSLNATTALVLVNTVYFRDDWAYPFSPDLTENAPFHLSAEETVEAPLMFKEELYAYADLGDFEMVSLPYNNTPGEIDFNAEAEPEYDPACSMLVLVPKEVDGLADLEAQLSSENLAEWLGSLEQTALKLYLPRFKSEAEFDLGETLAALGMPTAFAAGQADFSGISTESDLWISAVRHKTFIEVDEEGTEAAAATGIAMLRGGPPRGDIEFRADRPFVYMIVNQETGAVLFLGRVTDPTQ